MARRAIYSNWVRSIQHLKGILRSFIPLFSFLLASFFLSSSLYSVYCSIYSCIKSGGFLLPLQLIPSFSSPSFLPLFSLVFFSHPCSSSSLFSFISFPSSFLFFFCLSHQSPFHSQLLGGGGLHLFSPSPNPLSQEFSCLNPEDTTDYFSCLDLHDDLDSAALFLACFCFASASDLNLTRRPFFPVSNSRTIRHPVNVALSTSLSPSPSPSPGWN